MPGGLEPTLQPHGGRQRARLPLCRFRRTVPLEILPPAAQNVARALPLTQLVSLLRGLWLGEGWQPYVTETVVLAGMLVGGTALAAWLFRWE